MPVRLYDIILHSGQVVNEVATVDHDEATCAGGLAFKSRAGGKVGWVFYPGGNAVPYGSSPSEIRLNYRGTPNSKLFEGSVLVARRKAVIISVQLPSLEVAKRR